MGLSDSRRRTLAFLSLGLFLLALSGAIVARLFIDGYLIDWPWMGLIAASMASIAAVLIKPTRSRLGSALEGIAIALTFPLATWVLWRIFA
jgi:hypothetical protein